MTKTRVFRLYIYSHGCGTSIFGLCVSTFSLPDGFLWTGFQKTRGTSLFVSSLVFSLVFLLILRLLFYIYIFSPFVASGGLRKA